MNFLEKLVMRRFLNNKKTYLVAVGIGLTAASHYAGIIDDETAKVLYGLLGGGALVTMRAAIKKSGTG